MRRGTTKRLLFRLPIETERISVLMISFAQDGKVIFDKNINECSLAGNRVVTWLTAEDTKKLSAYVGYVEVQMHGETEDGYSFATKIIKEPVKRILNKGSII